MFPRFATLTAVVLLAAAATPAVAWHAPPTGQCVSVELEGRHLTVVVQGPADVEAWVKEGEEWETASATFNGVVVPSGYQWVPDSAVVEADLPAGAVEFRVAVWSTGRLDDTCYVAVPEQPPAEVPSPPAVQPEAPPPAAPLVQPPPARVGIKKTGPRTVTAGDRALYRIRVRNTTDRRLLFTVLDRLPKDVRLTVRRRGWIVRGRTVRVPMVLRPRQTRVLTVPIRVLATARGRRCNTAALRGHRIIPVASQTCARVTRRVGAVLPAVTG